MRVSMRMMMVAGVLAWMAAAAGAMAYPFDSASSSFDPSVSYDFDSHLASYSTATDPALAAALARCDDHILMAHGVGVHMLSSDTAEVRATIEERQEITDPKITTVALAVIAAGVQRRVAERTSKVVAYLQEDPSVVSSISKLRTNSIIVQPEYTWRNNERILTGYKAVTQLTFEMAMELAGQVMDAIIERGVTAIDSLKFFPSPPRLQKARKLALATAFADALSQARTIVDELRASAPSSLSSTPLRVIKVEIVSLTQPLADEMAPRAYASLHRREINSDVSSPVPPTVPIIGAEQRIAAEVVVKVKY